MAALGQEDRHWGIRALEFVEAVDTANSADAVTNLFKNAIAQAGFSAYVMCGLPDAQTEFRNRIVANGWPPEWLTLYLRDNLAKDDPVERHCLCSVEPFDWSGAPYDAEEQPRARDVMRRAADFGMKEGYCVPIHYGDGSGSAVSIAGEQPDFGRGVRAAMHLMSLYAHHAVRSRLRPAASRTTRLLTDREREVLRWAAVGKTDWEISVILRISRRTAHAHMQNAAHKLNAVNRVSTIVRALRAGEITL